WTKATTLLLEENVGHGGGVIATALFMDWLFQSLPLRKVYQEAYGYNAGVLRMWRKIGLIEEGVLKEDRYWNGAYWDLHIFALYREAWPKMRNRVLRHHGRPERPPAHSAGKKMNQDEPLHSDERLCKRRRVGSASAADSVTPCLSSERKDRHASGTAKHEENKGQGRKRKKPSLRDCKAQGEDRPSRQRQNSQPRPVQRPPRRL